MHHVRLAAIALLTLPLAGHSLPASPGRQAVGKQLAGPACGEVAAKQARPPAWCSGGSVPARALQ